MPNLLICTVKSSAGDHPRPLPCFKYSWFSTVQNALRVGMVPGTVFLVTRRLLRSKKQDVKDFKLNCLCKRHSQKECQSPHPVSVMERQWNKEKHGCSFSFSNSFYCNYFAFLLSSHCSQTQGCDAVKLENMINAFKDKMNDYWGINSILANMILLMEPEQHVENDTKAKLKWE